MKSQYQISPSVQLAIRPDHKLPYIPSLVVTILLATVSLSGILFPSSIYTTGEMMQSYFATDVVNLAIGLPCLLVSMWLTRWGKLTGLLLWPGSLLYVVYTYIAYIFGIPFSMFTLAFIALVLLSCICLFDLFRTIDENTVKTQLAGLVYERLSGWVLILFGIAFIFRAIGIIISAVMNRNTLTSSGIGVLIADIVFSVFWLFGGTMLVQWKPLGYASGLGFLFAGCTLFIGLIVFLLLQPLFTDAQFLLIDVVVVAVIGMVCFIPFGLYLRGVLSTEKK